MNLLCSIGLHSWRDCCFVRVSGNRTGDGWPLHHYRCTSCSAERWDPPACEGNREVLP